MARLPRITVRGIAHHVTQRGNRRQQIFIQEDDYAPYRDLLAQHCEANGVEVWSYCFCKCQGVRELENCPILGIPGITIPL